MATAKKHAHKPAPPNQPLPEGMLGTKDVAERLHITPRELRVILRGMGKGTGGERYAWKENDPFLTKLPELIKEHKEKPAEKK